MDANHYSVRCAPPGPRLQRLLVSIATIFAATCSHGASYRTQNFIVSAPTPELCSAIGQVAERCRNELAVEWLGNELPQWTSPCPITANVSDKLGAGGETSFVFEQGNVGGWRMTVQGSAERILDSVIPHEVTHTIFATHFRRPLPRWADEGACTTVEAASEQTRYQQMLTTFLMTNRGIPTGRLLAMREYPADILPLYAQGHSLSHYLIAQGGKRKFVRFLADGLTDESWPRALRKFYGDESAMALQNRWLDWVRRGSPMPAPKPSQPRTERAELLVRHEPRQRPTPNLVLRVAHAGSQLAMEQTESVSSSKDDPSAE